MGATDPVVTFLLVLVIGIVAGILFDRLAGPSWLARQFSGSTRGTLGGWLSDEIQPRLAFVCPRGIVGAVGLSFVPTGVQPGGGSGRDQCCRRSLY